MTVTTIASIAANLSRVTTTQATQPAAVLNSLVSTQATTDTSTINTDDTADVSLQGQIAQFSVASQGIAAGNTALASASVGAGDISSELGALQDLAQKAANVPLSESERAQIDAQFQAIRSRINQIAVTTKFGNDTLLDGSTNAAASAAASPSTPAPTTIGSLTDAALFKGGNPNLLTVADSQQAVQQVQAAQTYTSQQINSINTLQVGLDYAASTVQTAVQNQLAAQSTLEDADFETTDTSTTLLQPDAAAQVAQTTRLPSSLLGLLSD